MGSTCCNGRRIPSPVPKKPAKPVIRQQNRPRLSTRVSERSDLSVRTQQSPSPTLLLEGSKSKAVSLRFQDSLIQSSFSYSLSALDQLSSDQKVAIHKLLKGSGDSEFFLGYAPVLVSIHGSEQEQRVAIVGSKSLILVRGEEYAVVRRRVLIGEIRMISMSPDRSGAIFHVRPGNETTYSDISLSSVKLDDLLKAVQQAHFESFAHCISTQLLDTKTQFFSVFNQLSDSQLELAQSELAQKVNEVTAKFGLVGEMKVFLKQGSYFLDRREVTRYCLVTSHAVYCLDEKFECYGRLSLKELRHVIAVTGKELLILASEEEEQIWALPPSVGETILKAANRQTPSPLKLKWKSTQSFLSEQEIVIE